MPLLTSLCWLALAAPPLATQSAQIEAAVDPRVELMSIIFRLAGNPEYNMPNSQSPYADDVAAHFGPFRDHPVVKLARKLRQEHGVSYDAVMGQLVTDSVAFLSSVTVSPI